MAPSRALPRSLTALALLTPLISFANTPAFNSGFYLGAKLAAEETMASWETTTIGRYMDSNFLGTTIFGIELPDQEQQSFDTHLMGNVGLGYAYVGKKLFLAAEFFTDLGSSAKPGWEEIKNLHMDDLTCDEIDNAAHNINYEVLLKYRDIIFDLRPGILLAQNFLLYGRLGVAFNTLSIEQEGAIVLSEDTETNTINIVSSDQEDVAALRAGLGVEYKLTPNLALNMDYVFTNYGSIDTEFSSTDTVLDPLSSEVISTAQADVTKNAISAGFNWYFDGDTQSLTHHKTASNLTDPVSFTNGFYIGGKAGAQQMMSKWDGTNNFSVSNPFLLLITATPPEQSIESFQTNLMGNVGLGYAYIMQKLFLAAEFSMNLAEKQESYWQQAEHVVSDGTDVIQNIDSEVTLENPDLIFDLRPGILLTPNFLFYGRIGAAFNELSIEQEGYTTVYYFDAVATNAPIYSADSNDVFALRAGLGMEYKLTKNLAMNADYVYTDYGSIDTEFSSNHLIFNGDNILNQNVSSKADVTKSTATLGLNWYF